MSNGFASISSSVQCPSTPSNRWFLYSPLLSVSADFVQFFFHFFFNSDKLLKQFSNLYPSPTFQPKRYVGVNLKFSNSFNLQTSPRKLPRDSRLHRCVMWSKEQERAHYRLCFSSAHYHRFSNNDIHDSSLKKTARSKCFFYDAASTMW